MKAAENCFASEGTGWLVAVVKLWWVELMALP